MKLLASILVVVLTGCATCEPEVRVIRPPVPPVIEMPDKPNIPATATQSDKLKAVAEYILELRTRLEQAVAALDVYRN